MTTTEFRVLLVCTGNICRSPAAEFLLRSALRRRGYWWQLSSAGTGARDGGTMHPDAAEYLHSKGIGLAEPWTSHALTPVDIEQADLILTATHRHTTAVTGIVAGALGHTFPLSQFARLVEAASDVSSSGPELLERANLARPRVATIDPRRDDIGDPIGRSRRYFRKRLDEIDVATRTIADGLAPLSGG